MINLLRRIKAKIIDIVKWMYIRKQFKSNFKKKSVIILGTPLHGNIGDQAITLAEYNFFEHLGYAVCEVPSPYVVKKMKWLKRIIGSRKIFVHGGGFIGSLWPAEEAMFEKILEEFAENEIIVLPQTIYFYEEDTELLRHFNDLLCKCKNVTICAREEKSYQYAKENLKNGQILLVPDMVLSQIWKESAVKTRTVALCIRRDHEKVLLDSDLERMIQIVKEKIPETMICYTDTVKAGSVFLTERAFVVREKIREFASYDYVITDRLHGMVLSALAGTKTLVYSNCNYKVKGTYNWIKYNNFISYVSSPEVFEQEFQKLMDYSGDCNYSNERVLEYYESLKEKIGVLNENN